MLTGVHENEQPGMCSAVLPENNFTTCSVVAGCVMHFAIHAYDMLETKSKSWPGFVLISQRWKQ